MRKSHPLTKTLGRRMHSGLLVLNQKSFVGITHRPLLGHERPKTMAPSWNWTTTVEKEWPRARRPAQPHPMYDEILHYDGKPGPED
eukprot:11174151-Lingulodinium_polyedra.AAC.1